MQSTPVGGQDRFAFSEPEEYFKRSLEIETAMISDAKASGKRVVGIYCEFTPRELILAAGAIPVCLCGSSNETISAAEKYLPSNLCPLIKSSFGYIVSNNCSFFNAADLIVAETTCDGKKKMYELITEKKNIHVLELTQKVDEKDAYNHWKSEVIKLKSKLESTFNRSISDDDLRSAIRTMNRERALLRRAFTFGVENPSIVSGAELAALRYRLAGILDHHAMLEKYINKLAERKSQMVTIAPTSAPRILLTGCPTAQGTTKVIELAEKCGVVIVAQETCSGLKPLGLQVSEDNDPIDAIARKYFNLPCSCMTPNKGRLEYIDRLARQYQADAVIDLVWHACHTYNVESYLVEKYVKDMLGLQYLKVETDYSQSDRERIRVRIETMIEVIKCQ